MKAAEQKKQSLPQRTAEGSAFLRLRQFDEKVDAIRAATFSASRYGRHALIVDQPLERLFHIKFVASKDGGRVLLLSL